MPKPVMIIAEGKHRQRRNKDKRCGKRQGNPFQPMANERFFSDPHIEKSGKKARNQKKELHPERMNKGIKIIVIYRMYNVIRRP